MSEECNHYDILGINEGISKDKKLLKKVHKKLIKAWNPDHAKDEEKKKYEDITQRVNVAYDKLVDNISDANEKSSYNKNLVEFIIQDNDNNALVDVNIKVINDKTGSTIKGITKTCNVGNFFLDLPNGKHTIQVTKKGYELKEAHRTIGKKNSKIEIKLKKSNENEENSKNFDETVKEYVLEVDKGADQETIKKSGHLIDHGVPTTEKNYYYVLGVDKGADQKTIEKAHKDLTKIFLADSNSEDDVNDKLKEINEAYEVLSDSDERWKYDQQIETTDADENNTNQDDSAYESNKEDSKNFDETVKESNTKIYVNGEFIGKCENPDEFVSEMREKRRRNEISNEMNITYYEKTSEIYIWNDSGRARRPLIIVKDGVSLLEEKHIQQINDGEIGWDDLIEMGIIEYLDAEEEEDSYISVWAHELNSNHTHLEIDPATILGICAGFIPFSNHNSAPKNSMEAGMVKQALGLYVSNYMFRTDTRAHLLHHPQTPIVKTRISDTTGYDERPSGQNVVLAVMSFEGYNMEDALILNKSSLERGFARSSFFRSYETFEKKYPGGQADKFEVPGKDVRGYRSEDKYIHLDEDGIINPESYVESGDVLIGKTSPPRFLEEIDEFGSTNEKRRETSVTVKNGEKGVVDAVILTETVEGDNLTKVRIRDTRQPEFGDKFASRHGQKGVVGLILPQEDVPFTENGVVPDIIINPHAIPSRMSIGQVLEMVAGKAGCIDGEKIDGTPFDNSIESEVKSSLVNNGFEPSGCESLYNGMTGERFDAEIFVGVAYYQKLHHMTTDKIYARSRGPVQVLTRQPTEGRAREGGLRFGEMERDCLIAHGSALALKERLLDESDKYEAIVCNECGMLAVHDYIRNKIYCPICGEAESFPVEIAYAFKLLLDELKSLCIFPKLILEDKA
jgi:DNA-directed RNA polymerase subunit B'/DNA-directed RNA polymerase subunit B